MDRLVTDFVSINKVINLLYGRLPVYLIEDGQEFPVKIIAMKEKGLIIFNNRSSASSEINLLVIHNGTRILISFSRLGGDGKGTEILKPLKMSVSEAKRESNRVILQDNVPKLKVSNIINQNDIHKAIGFEDKQVDAIVKDYSQKLNAKFKNVNINISVRLDGRMRLMQNYDKPIYIPDRNAEGFNHPNFLPFNEYIRLVSVSKLNELFISEITVPLKYKEYSSLGYIQVNSENVLAFESFEVISKVAHSITNDMIGTGVFQESKEACEVNDLSLTGLSFLHPQSRLFSRSMTMGETIVFDLFLPDKKKIVCRGIIKNIKNTEVMFRVGIQFYNNTNSTNEAIKNFLDKNQE